MSDYSKDEAADKKPRVVFVFVEAGLGHIMPMRAISAAFERKYGDKTEIIKTTFFKDKNDPQMKRVEERLVQEVKRHNKSRIFGLYQFILLRMFGTRTSLKYLTRVHYGKGFLPSLDYVTELNPDLILNSHFFTLHYSCEARERGLINSKVLAYCPDPVIGMFWDRRVDVIGVSGMSGEEHALKHGFKKGQVAVVPFLIRDEVRTMTEGRRFYRKKLGLPEDNFTVLLADGAYGAGKLRATVLELMKSKQRMTVIAVCGRNEKLFEEFKSIKPPENITFKPYGFTDQMLTLSACCDLFVGKAGASNLAEPTYFGAPSIVTMRATPIEKWISAHFVRDLKCAVLCENAKRAARLTQQWAADPSLMKRYEEACKPAQRFDGPELFADIIWGQLCQKLEQDESAQKEINTQNT